MQKDHVLRRIRRAQIAVGIKKALVIGRAELLRINNLERITVFDIFLTAQHILGILLPALVARELAKLRTLRTLRLHRLQQHFLHRRNLALCLGIVNRCIIRLDIDD